MQSQTVSIVFYIYLAVFALIYPFYFGYLKMTAKLGSLIFVLFGMPVLYYICFHFGWGRELHSWAWVVGCWLAGGVYAVIHGYLDWRTPLQRAAINAVYLGVIFSLSCFAIIQGWGMQPRNWWLICIPYAFAAILPPFDGVAKGLMFWKPIPDPTPADHVYIKWLLAACAEGMAALDTKDETQRKAYEFMLDQIQAIRNPEIRATVEEMEIR